MPALDTCPAPDCRKEAFLILGGNKAYCGEHYVAMGGVM